MANDTPIIGILMGSKSDWDVMNNVMETLEALNIPYEAKILSAHRNPELVNDYSKTARDRGLKVIIAGAGMAAALPGVIAALTPLPVLGVPMETKVMGGMDSLLSMAQMPGGVPVGTLAIGKAGAKNPGAELFVYDLASQEVTRIDVGGGSEEYIYNIRTSPDGAVMLVNWTDRLQHHLKVMAIDLETGDGRLVVEERQETWQSNSPGMRYLADNHRLFYR